MKKHHSIKLSRLLLAGIALVLTSPLLLIAFVMIIFGAVLLLGLILKLLFGVGDFKSVNGDLVWSLNAHFYPVGLIIAVVLIAGIWLLKKFKNRFRNGN